MRLGFDPATSIPVPFSGATLHYVAFTTPAQVTTSNLTSIQTGIQAFKTLLPTAVAATNLFVYTRLSSLLASFQARLGTFIQPLYIVVAQIVGLALLFVIAMAELEPPGCFHGRRANTGDTGGRRSTVGGDGDLAPPWRLHRRPARPAWECYPVECGDQATIDTAQTHVPPYLLSFNPGGMLLFGAALVLVFMLALHVGAQVAERRWLSAGG
jgi:hypothetical protein